MGRGLSRRELLAALGASGLAAAGAGVPAAALADEADAAAPPPGGGQFVQPKGTPAILSGGKVIQPQRELPVLHKTDVLVIGGGPAGVAAALAARRAGADVTIVERYGHFGGQWTGGLVVLVVGMNVKGGRQVTKGIGLEMMQRLEKLDRGIINNRPGANPTVDAEALKFMMVEMIREAGVNVFLHCWGVDAIVDGTTVRGAVFESKSGRQAILANVVVDATGDGDIYAAAGAEHLHLKFRIGLVHRLGNLDKVDREKAKVAAKRPRDLGGATPIPGVTWVNMQGPEADALSVADLTRLELAHRRFIWRSLEEIRKTPGYEQVYIVETAPQLGVRISRLLAGVKQLTLKAVYDRQEFPDVVGVGGAWNTDNPEWQIPYGALVPRKIDNVLAAGRCVSAEAKMAELIRVIPPCFVTGHAAGVAAAVAVKDGCRPRDVDVAKVQKLLREQGAYLG